MNFEIKSTFKRLNLTFVWCSITLLTVIAFKCLFTSAQSIVLLPVSFIIERVYNVKAIAYPGGYYFDDLQLWLHHSNNVFNFFIVSFCLFSFTVPYYFFRTKQSIAFFVAAIAFAFVWSLIVSVAAISVTLLFSSLNIAIQDSTMALLVKVEKFAIASVALIIAQIIFKKCFIKIKNIYAQSTESKMAISH